MTTIRLPLDRIGTTLDGYGLFVEFVEIPQKVTKVIKKAAEKSQWFAALRTDKAARAKRSLPRGQVAAESRPPDSTSPGMGLSWRLDVRHFCTRVVGRTEASRRLVGTVVLSRNGRAFGKARLRPTPPTAITVQNQRGGGGHCGVRPVAQSAGRGLGRSGIVQPGSGRLGLASFRVSGGPLFETGSPGGHRFPL
jgi:hypothetical protein